MRGDLLEVGGKTRNLNEQVYFRLRDDLVNGRIPPGTRLVHRVLARELGTSTIPVIDALRQLEGEGLLISTPGEGTRVRSWELQDLYDAFRIRAAHEGGACGLFVERATRADMDVLESYNRAFDEATRRDDVAACNEADTQLHRHIVKATRSQLLARLVDNADVLLRTIAVSGVLLPQFVDYVGPLGVHRPLLDALASGDVPRAEQAGREHTLQSPAYLYLVEFNAPLAG